MVVKSKLAVELFWSDNATVRISQLYATVPPIVSSYGNDLLQFMDDECDFSMEHADGSFMDHLKFCHDYSAHNYSSKSPIPLFLHSIMGVGTNFFPMTVKSIPALKKCLSTEEYCQVEAFPSLLRLVQGTSLVQDLQAILEQNNIKKLKGLKFKRVIDNTDISLTIDQLRTQLNYQCMHLLDFLPTASWLSNMDDGFLFSFINLHGLLHSLNWMDAKIDFDLQSGEAGPDGSPMTLGGFIKSLLPLETKRKLNKKAIANFSRAINHSLEYEFMW
jgi:hypothetical protein